MLEKLEDEGDLGVHFRHVVLSDAKMIVACLRTAGSFETTDECAGSWCLALRLQKSWRLAEVEGRKSKSANKRARQRWLCYR